jgi:hypothetical protein
MRKPGLGFANPSRIYIQMNVPLISTNVNNLNFLKIRKTSSYPVSSVPVFLNLKIHWSQRHESQRRLSQFSYNISYKSENSLVPATRVPTPVIPVSVIPVFHIIFLINLIKKSSRQGPLAGTTGKSSRQGCRQALLTRAPASITEKSSRQA